MKIANIILVAAILTAPFSTRAAGAFKSFSPAAGIKAIVVIKGNNLVWKIYDKNRVKKRNITLDTERTPNIEVGSYDFSGRLGFSASYLDDGMGTYKISRVFTFSSWSKGFVERFPSCGDKFYNLRVDKKNRSLVSSYWDQNTPKLCITRLPGMR